MNVRVWGWVLTLGLLSMVAGAEPPAEPESGLTIQDQLSLYPTSTDEASAAARSETTDQSETSYQAPGVAPRPTPTPTPAAPTTTHERIAQTVDGATVRGYLARPVKGEPRAAVLLIHEWWGLTPALEAQADALAGQGYRVLAIDLFGGKTARARGEAAALLRQFKPAEALAQLKAALSLLARNGSGAPLKVGVIGWTWGAGQALALAQNDPRPAAVVLFHGPLTRDTAALARIKTPVLAFFVAGDAVNSPAAIDAFQRALRERQVDVQTYTFNTHPGFSLAPKDAVERGYAETAQTRIQELFARTLQ